MKKIIILLILASALLQGCTKMLWSTHGWNLGGQLTESRDHKTKVVMQDQLLGFAQVQPRVKASQAQSEDHSRIIIVGRDYAYALNQSQVKLLLDPALDVEYWRVQLPQSDSESVLDFHLYMPTQYAYHPETLNGQLFFNTDLQFIYEKPDLTVNEREALKKLKASLVEPWTGKQTNPEHNVFSIDVFGEIVGLNEEMKNLKYQKFSRTYAINIHEIPRSYTHVNWGTLFRQVALTPFTLAADLILVPVMLITK
ncbi:hypothetical protein EC844_10171 [Acinetobacter calcoaceticus]|uniref:Lipoprotein n=1 Tax=Acinetobacter calcoaceticus TaxID=471 RepID=A0A4R1Y511_ACICA|nr:hypothetical protein EC844_10171 [Acinetobacter calcoaceticus]